MCPVRENLPLRTSLGRPSRVCFWAPRPASCLGLSQKLIKMLSHLPRSSQDFFLAVCSWPFRSVQ